MRGELIKGFDYQDQAPLSLTRAEWRERLAIVLKAGGHRRVENGETFAHGKDGSLVFEAYANIGATP